MKVSVITTCLNSEKTITKTILSVLSQDYSNVEYIIIDGGSKDDSINKIKKYADKINVIVSEKDDGMYYAMNKGIALASGELIGILNSDDVFFHQNVISNVVESIKRNSSDCVYGDLIYCNEKGKVVRYWKSGSCNIKKFKFGWMPPHPTFFVKKNIYNNLGLFNVDFKSAADYELMLRLLYKHKINASYVPEVLVKMQIGGKSNKSLKNRLIANLEDKKAWDVNNIKRPFYTQYLKPFLKIPQYLKKY